MKLRPTVLAAVLALSACHRPAATPPATNPGAPASAAASGSFTPITGAAIPVGQVPLLEQINRENIRVINSALPGIVRISATVAVSSSGPTHGSSFPFERHPATPYSEVAYGAGVVIGKDGLIVTNSHVIDGAQSVEVQLGDQPGFFRADHQFRFADGCRRREDRRA